MPEKTYEKETRASAHFLMHNLVLSATKPEQRNDVFLQTVPVLKMIQNYTTGISTDIRHIQLLVLHKKQQQQITNYPHNNRSLLGTGLGWVYQGLDAVRDWTGVGLSETRCC